MVFFLVFFTECDMIDWSQSAEHFICFNVAEILDPKVFKMLGQVIALVRLNEPKYYNVYYLCSTILINICRYWL